MAGMLNSLLSCCDLPTHPVVLQPYFLPQCLGLLALHHLAEVENNNRAKTACRIFHQGTPNMSVLVQTGIPVGF